MKTLAALILVGSLSSAWAAEPASAPADPASAVAPLTVVPAKPARRASAPEPSPAVEAARNATVPGKVRPENPVVPQVSVTLPGSGKPGAALVPPTGPGNGQRDRAAACAARVTQAERDECERTL